MLSTAIWRGDCSLECNGKKPNALRIFCEILRFDGIYSHVALLSLSRISSLAPVAIRKLAIATLPDISAWCRGVLPSLSWIFSLELKCFKRFTRSIFWLITAWCRGVLPSSSWISGFAPLETKFSVSSLFWLITA